MSTPRSIPAPLRAKTNDLVWDLDLDKPNPKPLSRAYKRVHGPTSCAACGKACDFEFPTGRCNGPEGDDVWDRYVGSDEGHVYFCSDAHRESWLEDLYLK